MEKGILACLKEDISNVAKQDIIILGLHFRYYTGNRRGGHRIQTILYSLTLFHYDIQNLGG
jgi:hypothetical protein